MNFLSTMTNHPVAINNRSERKRRQPNELKRKHKWASLPEPKRRLASPELDPTRHDSTRYENSFNVFPIASVASLDLTLSSIFFVELFWLIIAKTPN